MNDRIENNENPIEEAKVTSPQLEKSDSKQERVLTIEDEKEKLVEERKRLLEA